MRIFLMFLGIVLLVAGLFVLLGEPTYPRTETLIQLGSAKLESTRAEPVPAWLGVAGVVAGGLVFLGGILRRR